MAIACEIDHPADLCQGCAVADAKIWVRCIQGNIARADQVPTVQDHRTKTIVTQEDTTVGEGLGCAGGGHRAPRPCQETRHGQIATAAQCSIIHHIQCAGGGRTIKQQSAKSPCRVRDTVNVKGAIDGIGATTTTTDIPAQAHRGI